MATVSVIYYNDVICVVDTAPLAVVAIEKVGLPTNREGCYCLPL